MITFDFNSIQLFIVVANVKYVCSISMTGLRCVALIVKQHTFFSVVAHFNNMIIHIFFCNRLDHSML